MSFIVIAAVTLFLATALGALGAHALAATLAAGGHAEVWQTAVLYHWTHGLSVLAIGIWKHCHSQARASGALSAAAVLWLIGIALFSGSLYFLALGAPKWLGPVTPLGGLCFLAGWIVLAVGAARLGRRGNGPRV